MECDFLHIQAGFHGPRWPREPWSCFSIGSSLCQVPLVLQHPDLPTSCTYYHGHNDQGMMFCLYDQLGRVGHSQQKSGTESESAGTGTPKKRSRVLNLQTSSYLRSWLILRTTNIPELIRLVELDTFCWAVEFCNLSFPNTLGLEVFGAQKTSKRPNLSGYSIWKTEPGKSLFCIWHQWSNRTSAGPATLQKPKISRPWIHDTSGDLCIVRSRTGDSGGPTTPPKGCCIFRRWVIKLFQVEGLFRRSHKLAENFHKPLVFLTNPT